MADRNKLVQGEYKESLAGLVCRGGQQGFCAPYNNKQTSCHKDNCIQQNLLSCDGIKTIELTTDRQYI